MAEHLFILTKLGEDTALKRDLNTCIVNLCGDKQPQFRPRRSLNGEGGVAILDKIAVTGADANTEVHITAYPIFESHYFWLNVRFVVLLNQNSTDSLVWLTPQQTGWVVKNMPDDTRKIVIQAVKKWYLEKFLEDMRKGLERVTSQFENGDPLLASDHENRVFDIHGDHEPKDLPYCESGIVGYELYWSIVEGGTLFEFGGDGLERSDELLLSRKKKQQDTASGFLNLARSMQNLGPNH